MSNIAYDEYGDIDVGRMAEATGADAATLAAMLRAVWLDAYVLGWSDGKRDADPDQGQNPYECVPGKPMNNPNGLSDSQIAARPKPFVGMLVYAEDSDGFGTFSRLPVVRRGDERYYLLPGEPGCPWPPPEVYRHEWRVGDRAWLYEPRPLFEGEENWKCVEVYRHMGELAFDDMEGRCEMPYSIDTPAIYIPEVGQGGSDE